MQYNFDDNDIRQQVLDFLASLGMQPHDERDIILDGELHRYRTHDDKPYQTSGAIRIHTDCWPAGFAQDWRKGVKENWKYEAPNLTDEQRTYFNSEEFKKKAEQEQRKAEEARKKKREENSGHARNLWNSLEPAPENHPYLQRKNIQSYGLHYNPETGCLAVPLSNIDELVMSIQWIPADKDKPKRFYAGASLDGVFFSIALDTMKTSPDQPILLGEGYATMAKVYELTGCPVVAAMSCIKLKDIAKILHNAYPNCKIIIMADNDWETEQKHGYNPGIRAAEAVLKAKLAAGIAAPEFTPEDTDLSDWDDFAQKHGDKKAASVLQKKIELASLPEGEREEVNARNNLLSVIHDLDPNKKLMPQEFIGGIFPRGYVSLLIAPPGTGKTIFVQRFVSDLSIGGSIFDGFIEDEPARKCLILAGEAGYELLVRRGASMKWAINSQNVKVLDQYEAETKDINVMLDTTGGLKNVERLIDMFKPDILFIDTFSSFHESDENKAPEMKPIIKRLARLAKENNIAIIPVHHSRKRAAKERALSLNQDDVIGSSIMNRLVGLIVGIEPMKDDEKVLLVHHLKSWFTPFTPFTYTLKENIYGGTTLQTDLAPAGVNNSKSAVWYYLIQNFNPGEWFTTSQIILSEIEGTVADRQLRRILADFCKNGRLERRGSTKNCEYSIAKKF